MRELLEQAVSQMTSTTSYDSRLKVEPWDYSIMEPLTQTGQPNSFLLIVGEDYLNEVQRHACYYAAKQRKRCWYLCLESTPMLNMLSMLNLASGVPRRNLLDLKVPPPYFGALNDGAAELYKADCRFSVAPPADLASIVSLAKQLRSEGIEVLLVDALHRIEFGKGRASTSTEQRWVAQALRAVAHASELTVIAGFHRLGDPFADLPSDSTFFCEP